MVARKKRTSDYLPDGRMIGRSRRALMLALYRAPGFRLDAFALFRSIYDSEPDFRRKNGPYYSLVRLARKINAVVGADAVTFSGQFKTPETFRLYLDRIPAGAIIGHPKPSKPLPGYWTPQEDAVLREMRSTHPSTDISMALAQRLGSQRSPGAIYTRAKLLGLPDYEPEWTREEIGRLFAIDAKDVIYRWVQPGLLRGEKKSRTRAERHGARNTRWAFREVDIKEFIRRYPWEYDVRAMPPAHRLTRYARTVHRDELWVTPNEARRRLGVKKTTFYTLVETGRLDNVRYRQLGYRRIGKYREQRISTRALGAYLATHGGTGHGNGERGSDGHRRASE